MHLNITQRNNLRTGVNLAAELPSSSPNLRKFITIHSYSYNPDGRRVKLGKILNAVCLDDVYFELRCYELPIDYINSWDVTEDDLTNKIYLDDIKGVELLENELQKYLPNFSALVPEWHCDVPLYIDFMSE